MCIGTDFLSVSSFFLSSSLQDFSRDPSQYSLRCWPGSLLPISWGPYQSGDFFIGHVDLSYIDHP